MLYGFCTTLSSYQDLRPTILPVTNREFYWLSTSRPYDERLGRGRSPTKESCFSLAPMRSNISSAMGLMHRCVPLAMLNTSPDTESDSAFMTRWMPRQRSSAYMKSGAADPSPCTVRDSPRIVLVINLGITFSRCWRGPYILKRPNCNKW